MNDEIKEILDMLKQHISIVSIEDEDLLLDFITNLRQENKTLHENNQNMQEEMARVWEENERLKKEVAKLHIIQEEYGSHIENTHIIDDYQKTYFMSNKWLIELKNGKFVYIDELNDKYEDYKSRCEKINEILKESPDFNYSNDYIILKRRIESILQGENNE